MIFFCPGGGIGTTLVLQRSFTNRGSEDPSVSRNRRELSKGIP